MSPLTKYLVSKPNILLQEKNIFLQAKYLAKFGSNQISEDPTFILIVYFHLSGIEFAD